MPKHYTNTTNIGAVALGTYPNETRLHEFHCAAQPGDTYFDDLTGYTYTRGMDGTRITGISDTAPKTLKLEEPKGITKKTTNSVTSHTNALGTPGIPWRCFHCDAIFHDGKDAKAHFGASEVFAPICHLSPDDIRAMEEELMRYREEDTALHREIAGFKAELASQLKSHGDTEYAKGIRDARLEGIEPIAREAANQILMIIRAAARPLFVKTQTEPTPEDLAQPGEITYPYQKDLATKATELLMRGNITQIPRGNGKVQTDHLFEGPWWCLNSQERFLLEWLAKEDSSALGECQGKDLDSLVARNLAQIHGSRVRITPLGIGILRQDNPEEKKMAEEAAVAEGQIYSRAEIAEAIAPSGKVKEMAGTTLQAQAEAKAEEQTYTWTKVTSDGKEIVGPKTYSGSQMAGAYMGGYGDAIAMIKDWLISHCRLVGTARNLAQHVETLDVQANAEQFFSAHPDDVVVPRQHHPTTTYMEGYSDAIIFLINAIDKHGVSILKDKTALDEIRRKARMVAIDAYGDPSK